MRRGALRLFGVTTGTDRSLHVIDYGLISISIILRTSLNTLDSYIRFYMSIKLPKEHEFILMYKQMIVVSDYHSQSLINQFIEKWNEENN
jgi:hypothetical protein